MNGLAGVGQRAGECVVVGGLVVRDHQVAANRVGVDRTVQMTSAVEVVGEAERESAAQVALDA